MPVGLPARPRADLRRRAEARRLLLPGSGRGGRRPASARASAAPGRRRPRRPGARRATCRAPPARISTPRPVETRTEVLVPNTFSDSNLLLGQMQMLWALMHNAIAGDAGRDPRARRRPSSSPRRINRGIYRDRHPPRHARHLADAAAARPLRRRRRRAGWSEPAFFRTPREFMAGVGRLGHGLVREIYSLNDQMEVMRACATSSATPAPAGRTTCR